MKAACSAHSQIALSFGSSGKKPLDHDGFPAGRGGQFEDCISSDDRNDRDLRLVQGSALDRLLSDKALRSRLGSKLAKSDVKEALEDKATHRPRQFL